MGRSYSRKGLEIGWALARAKKLPPKPCLVCGADVFYKKSTEDRAKYCSVACKRKAMVGKKFIQTKSRTGKVVTCLTCGKEFYRMPSQLKKGERVFCSMECRNKGDYMGDSLRGSNNHGWKGGRMCVGGYVYILSPEHPSKNSGGYVAEHRLVMEEFIERYLKPTESVHHRNAIRDDNRIENLQVVVDNVHKGAVKCPFCEEEFLIR